MINFDGDQVVLLVERKKFVFYDDLNNELIIGANSQYVRSDNRKVIRKSHSSYLKKVKKAAPNFLYIGEL